MKKRIKRTDKNMLIVIGWALIIAGWLANHWLSEIRDRRKEVRSALDSFHSKVESLRDEAIKFHVGKEYNENIANSLLMTISKLEVIALRLRLLNEENVARLFKGTRQAITLNNFESSSFICLPMHSSIIIDIEISVEDISSTMESAYSYEYPINFPFYNFKNN